MEASSNKKHKVVIVGGGTAGVTIAARLRRARPDLDVAIVEPSEDHYYQPLWSFVGAGVMPREDSRRPQADLIPNGVEWHKDFVISIDAGEKSLTTARSGTIDYDYLVLCPGIQIDWDKVDGLRETIGKNGVCSNYDYDLVPYTWETMKSLESGRALFTQPSTPIKCGGAPQKIMYLTADNLRQRGRLDRTDIHFFSPGATIFGVDGFRETLLDIIDDYGIDVHYKHDLIAVDGATQTATFRVTAEDGSTSETHESFDMLHVAPPQSAPHFVATSALANGSGWLDVSAETLQHTRYPEVFGAGDVNGTPNAKTGAAVRKQAPIVVENLLQVIDAGSISKPAIYDGYSSCPLITSYRRVVLAEFGYGNKPMSSFPMDTTKARYSMYLLKRYMLPWLYWNLMLRGKA